jgi:Ca2+-binding EF-hand superfamily protein
MGGGGNPWAGGGMGGPPGGGFGGPGFGGPGFGGPGFGRGGPGGPGGWGRDGGNRDGGNRDGDRRDGDRRRDERRDESKQSDDAGSSKSDSKEEPKKEEPKKDSDDGRKKFARYAESLVKRYDKNGNGTLEKEEWASMSGEPRKADTDGDGKITLEELTNQLASYSQASPSSSGSSGSSREGSDQRRDDSSNRGSLAMASGGRPMRFLTPTERLPSGLPGWFSQSDRDGDGQVMMSEYASSWTDEKIKEFNRYDLNADGAITPSECLAADGGSRRGR